jgi:hypothetical protein
MSQKIVSEREIAVFLPTPDAETAPQALIKLEVNNI